MLVQPTTIAQAQAAGSPYFWDNGKKKLAVTAEQLAEFKAGGRYDPAGGSALTQWANIQNQPQMDTPGYIDKMPERAPPPEWGYIDKRPEPSMMDRVKGFVGGLIPRATTESGARSENPWQLADRPPPEYDDWRSPYFAHTYTPEGGFERRDTSGWERYPGEEYKTEGGRSRGYYKDPTTGDLKFKARGTQQQIGTPSGRGYRREGRVAPVSYSQVAVDKIADWEGFREKPYMDAGSLRIGYGRKAKKGETTTSDKERGNLMTKVQDIGDWLDGVVTADLNANQKAALTSLVYNVGQGSFKKSKALKALNAGDMDEFKRQAFSKEQGWVKSKGKFVKGLHNRRQKEQALFFG